MEVPDAWSDAAKRAAHDMGPVDAAGLRDLHIRLGELRARRRLEDPDFVEAKHRMERIHAERQRACDLYMVGALSLNALVRRLRVLEREGCA